MKLYRRQKLYNVIFLYTKSHLLFPLDFHFLLRAFHQKTQQKRQMPLLCRYIIRIYDRDCGYIPDTDEV